MRLLSFVNVDISVVRDFLNDVLSLLGDAMGRFSCNASDTGFLGTFVFHWYEHGGVCVFRQAVYVRMLLWALTAVQSHPSVVSASPSQLFAMHRCVLPAVFVCIALAYAIAVLCQKQWPAKYGEKGEEELDLEVAKGKAISLACWRV